MPFTSIYFLILVSITYLLFHLCNRFFDDKRATLYQQIILWIASCIFIAYENLLFLIIILLFSFIIYLCGKKKEYKMVGVVGVTLFLIIIKYQNILFKTDSYILPLGISFYTFSAIQYLVDISKEKETVHSFFEVSSFLLYFPKLVAGPIQKSQDFYKQFTKKKNLSFENFSTGIQIFCFGLFKKMVLADRLSVFVGQVFETPKVFSSFTILLAILSYTLEIYFDFSGYSDMAIGISKLFDIDLPINFNVPYFSIRISEFWKRWHISLSNWLMEYIYIPLGGNRKGRTRTYLNLILTMVIGGLWHGSTINYLIWGLLNGIALVIDKMISKEKSSIFTWMITFLFINLSWVFFRADSLETALEILERCLSFKKGVTQIYFWSIVSILLSIFFTIMLLRKNKKENQTKIQSYYPILNWHKFTHLVIFFILCGAILCFAYTGFNPFIYANY